MSSPAHRSPQYLLPSILGLILLLAPLVFAANQTEPVQPQPPEVGADNAPSEPQAEGHRKGKGGCGGCDPASDRESGGDRGHPCEGQHEGSAKGEHGPGPRHPSVANAHLLLSGHAQLERTVEDIPNGVRTVTTTDDPELLITLRTHVQEMSALLDEGGHIRRWDPLFIEIFEHSESIQIEIEEVDDGVAITETSDDDEVVKLIRAHARKVDEFVARGHEACREETPLPPDYSGR